MSINSTYSVMQFHPGVSEGEKPVKMALLTHSENKDPSSLFKGKQLMAFITYQNDEQVMGKVTIVDVKTSGSSFALSLEWEVGAVQHFLFQPKD